VALAFFLLHESEYYFSDTVLGPVSSLGSCVHTVRQLIIVTFLVKTRSVELAIIGSVYIAFFIKAYSALIMLPSHYILLSTSASCLFEAFQPLLQRVTHRSRYEVMNDFMLSTLWYLLIE
jgi:uncharacterized membrane protein